MHTPKKYFSQNFLINKQTIGQIVYLFSPKPQQSVVEIGPGTGAITKLLSNELSHLTVVEIDSELADKIANWQYENITIHNQNILKYNFNDIKKPFRVIGNIPYHISSEILFHLLKFYNQIEDITLMLQREFAKRIISPANCGEYGRLSVMMQANYQVEEILQIPSDDFYPKPKVDSSIVFFKPQKNKSYNIKSLEKIVKNSFSMRRKKLKNNLKGILNQLETDIDLNLRAENLDVADFIKLSQDYDRII